MKIQNENSHESITWSEIGKQKVQAKRFSTSEIAKEIGFAFRFSALHFIWLPLDSKSDNVWRLLLQLKTIDLHVLSRTLNVTVGNRFFQMDECAYVPITWKKNPLRTFCGLKWENKAYPSSINVDKSSLATLHLKHLCTHRKPVILPEMSSSVSTFLVTERESLWSEANGTVV